MKRILYPAFVFGVSLTLAGCSLFGWGGPKRAAWRTQAENACLSSGEVKPSADVRPLDEVDGPGACGADRPFKVIALGRNQRIPLNEQAAMNCPLVAATDNWLERIVQPAAESFFGQPVVGVEHMGTYSCRNIAGSRYMSEHAYMNAIDVSGFKLADGRTVRVKTGWRSADASEANFLRAVGGQACDDFSTVLGPAAGAAHQDHLHMDLARHSKGRRVCRGGEEPVPEGGRLFSFFKDDTIFPADRADRTGSIPEEDGVGEPDPDLLDK
jgi:hypothetical protein